MKCQFWPESDSVNVAAFFLDDVGVGGLDVRRTKDAERQPEVVQDGRSVICQKS